MGAMVKLSSGRKAFSVDVVSSAAGSHTTHRWGQKGEVMTGKL
jgi:hypothetical protein